VTELGQIHHHNRPPFIASPGHHVAGPPARTGRVSGRLALGLTLYAVTSNNSGYGSFGDHYPHRDRHRSEAGPPAAIGQGGLVAAQFVASKTPPCTRMSPGRATALWMFNQRRRVIRRLVSHSQLNSPWGLALAPAGFGGFARALLIGRFGDGHINAYNPGTGTYLSQLRGPDGHKIVIDGLWGLRFVNGNAAKTADCSSQPGPTARPTGC
jgi:hypothetical protein